MRALVTLGVASLLVWIVPMVFLSSRQADVVSSVPVQPVGQTGGASATGAEVVLADPIGAANDLQAQNLLNTAIRVSQVWYAENGTYAGLGPEQASQYEPSIYFTSGSPAPGAVALRVTPDSVVMVTVSTGGSALCAAASLDVVSFGRTDASTPQQCQGGW
jgi:hypothetical protein